MLIRSACIAVIVNCAVCLGVLRAQDAPASQAATLQAVLQRLDALEKQNRALGDEIHALRQELATAHVEAPIDERVAVVEHRVDEQSQTKVEASHKFPLSVSGTLLFNTFMNSYSKQTPDSYYFLNGPNESGATLRQTILGLEYQGPSLPGDGKVSGRLTMDFYSGASGRSYPTNDWLRLRTADLSFDWANRSFSVGQQKPLIAPYNPDSLAEVGVLPLAGSGNLWLWLPQARYEERIHFGPNTGLTAQVALLQTQETYAYVPASYLSSVEASRPAIEGRLALWRKWSDDARIEIGSGFHEGTSHVAGTSVASRMASVDWLVQPWPKVQFSGTFFEGRNMGNVGALPESFTFLPTGAVIPVHGQGGWLQASYHPTSRLTFNLFSGWQGNRPSDLVAGNTLRDFTYAGNLIYRLGPNVLLGFEALQLRSLLLAETHQLHNHYDVSIAYLF